MASAIENIIISEERKCNKDCRRNEQRWGPDIAARACEAPEDDD